MKKPNLTPLEEVEQAMLATYLDQLVRQGKVQAFSATAQSTFTSFKQKNKNKKMGVRKGLPDVFIVFDNCNIWIEMKRKEGSKVSPEQKQFLEAIKNSGTKAFICHGYEEAKEVVNRYI